MANMRTELRLIVAIALWSGCLYAAPAITGVVNSASLLPPGTPNGALAQGAIFNVFGSGLGPATLLAAPLPLPTQLGGTTVDVTVGAITVQAPMFYTVASQLAAILPSNTPVGTGTVTVKFGGASATSAVTVVASNVGIYTANLSGSGPGVVTFGDYSALTSTKSAKAGDALIIWATGLGPISTSDANPPTVADLGTKITIYVGGVAVIPFYRGRSGYAGLDQINFIVPPGVGPGCGVSLVIQTGTLVSNNTTIPVSASGGACANANANLTNAQISVLQNKSSIKVGAFQYEQQVSNTFNQDGKAVRTNSAGVVLIGLDQVNFPLLLSAVATVTPGSCTVTVIKGQRTEDNSLFAVARLVNAGSILTLTQPNGSAISLASGGTDGTYSGVLNSYQSGVVTITGTGGPDLGAFSTAFTLQPQLNWSNLAIISGSVIDRTQPLTVRWNGGDPDGFVDVLVSTRINQNGVQLEVEADCAGPVSAGSLTVPPSVLLAMPAGAGAFANVTVIGNNSQVPLLVPGMDAVILQADNATEVIASMK